MLSNLTRLPLETTAFSRQPFSLFSGKAHEDLATILEMDLIENGDRAAREHWQERQFQNLVRHAVAKSPFWRKRLTDHGCSLRTLGSLPVLTRSEVVGQVEQEGSLLGPDTGQAPETYQSSGSTATPVKVHVSNLNGRNNVMRSVAQYIMDGRPLDEARTFIKPGRASLMTNPAALLGVERHSSWIGSLTSVFTSGPYKVIDYTQDPAALLAELKRDRVGYLACPSTFMHSILEACSCEEFLKLGIAAWLHHSDYLDPAVAERVRGLGIAVSSNYSCAEAGALAYECTRQPGSYHVTHSNVVIECDRTSPARIDGIALGRILITHLHSYATPLIRYDVGDFADMASRCACGHDGPTLTRLHGRGKLFLRHPDGTLLHFPIYSARLLEIVTFKEFWIQQTDAETIVLRLGGCPSLSAEQATALTAFIRRLSDPVFKLRIILSDTIDWSANPKRLPFTSLVA